jgi:hypothetical protein
MLKVLGLIPSTVIINKFKYFEFTQFLKEKEETKTFSIQDFKFALLLFTQVISCYTQRLKRKKTIWIGEAINYNPEYAIPS